MSAQELVDKQIQVFNQHDADGWVSFYAENAVLYDPQYPEPLRGRQAIRKDIEAFFRAFPDIRFTSTDTISSGDRVANHGVGSGTNSGPLELPTGTIQGTNKRVEIPFASFARLDGSGLIAEERRYYDLAGMLTQLGLMG